MGAEAEPITGDDDDNMSMMGEGGCGFIGDDVEGNAVGFQREIAQKNYFDGCGNMWKRRFKMLGSF